MECFNLHANYRISCVVFQSPMFTTCFRVEETPSDELVINKDEVLVGVAHFHKEVYSTFGIPFMIKLKQGEHLDQVRERIQKKLDVPDKEFQKVCNIELYLYVQ